MTRFRALSSFRPGPSPVVAPLALALTLLVGGCTGTPRSVKSLPPTEYKALQEIGDRVGEESKKLAEENARLRAEIERNVPRLAPVPVVAPRYDPLENRIVTLNMNDASVGGLLWALAEQLGMNLIVDPDVLARDQRASLFLKNVTAREVYNHILSAFDLYGETRGGALVVSPMEERVFNVEMLNTTTSLDMSTGGDVFGAGSSGSGGGGDSLRGKLVLDGTVGKQNDPYKQLGASVEAVLREDPGMKREGEAREAARFSLDPLTGSLFVRARPSQVRAVADLVERNKAMLARQVLVEAQLIDVQLNDDFQYGVDWNLLKNRVAGIVGDAPISLDPITGSLPGANHDSLGRLLTIPRQTIGSALGRGTGIGYVGDTFSTALNVLRSFGHVKVLSNPSVRVRNGTPAYLSVGRNIRYVSKSTTSFSNPGGGATNTSSDVQTESLFSGVVIGVAPLIRNDGNVELLVHPMQTEIDESSLALVEVGNGNSVTLPRISFKGMTTTLNLRDGNTVLIGGLIDQQDQNTDNGVPGLSDVPGLGKLFGAEARTHKSRELVMVLRVTVI
ncbi:pilus (MSHA type) biogenesis protein MshL [Stenotrophomonas sp. HITSZ_GD]|uniref:pilus (MSHA type) biogenesis protein MshL n=1 Tax=Stenotrophomonas sp. HITSZ_GD TaxID=3037248 RepID=UPI00240E745E|nr:pilus (MSHA type) biogenesis protein MshL [Stenotrophomonas sp. HITSZ_GD]MDG2526201.1 pilus (MSHA type) biogenesis protein MshL [Stenotrophomonas sp. HITSZ_GD]